MENELQQITKVIVYIDDILIPRGSKEEHLTLLNTVLKRLKETRMRFFFKCLSMNDSVVDVKGIHPIAEKVQAIQEAPEPKNVTELKSYVGFLRYYVHFQKIATVLAPLYRLLRSGVRWSWAQEQLKSRVTNIIKVMLNRKTSCI